MVYGRILDTIIFLGLSGLFFCVSMALLFSSLQTGQLAAFSRPGRAGLPVTVNPGMNNTPGQGMMTIYYEWFVLCWAVFFCYLWIASFKAGVVRMLFLLLFWLEALAMAIGGWIGSVRFEILNGYLILISAILAFIVSASEIVSFRPAKLFRKKTISLNRVTIEDSTIPDERRPRSE